MSEEIDKLLEYFDCKTIDEVMSLEEGILKGLGDESNSEDLMKGFEECHKKLQQLKNIVYGNSENHSEKMLVDEMEMDEITGKYFKRANNLLRRINFSDDSFEKCLLELEIYLEDQRGMDCEKVHSYIEKAETLYRTPEIKDCELQKLFEIRRNNPSSYDSENISSLVKEVLQTMRPFDIYKAEYFAKFNETMGKRLQNKNVFVILGETGSGKSTLLSYLSGTQFEESLTKEGFHFLKPVSNEKHPNAMEIFKSSAYMESETKGIYTYELRKPYINSEPLLLCDIPGFFDTRGVEIELANSITLTKVLKKAKSVKLGIIISERDLGEKLDGIKRILELSNLMIDGFQNMKKSAIFIFTKFQSDSTYKDFIQKLKGLKFNDLNPDLNKTLKDLIDSLENKAISPIQLYRANPLDRNPEMLLAKITDLSSINQPALVFKYFISQLIKEMIVKHLKLLLKRINEALKDLQINLVEQCFEEFGVWRSMDIGFNDIDVYYQHAQIDLFEYVMKDYAFKGYLSSFFDLEIENPSENLRLFLEKVENCLKKQVLYKYLPSEKKHICDFYESMPSILLKEKFTNFLPQVKKLDDNQFIIKIKQRVDSIDFLSAKHIKANNDVNFLQREFDSLINARFEEIKIEIDKNINNSFFDEAFLLLETVLKFSFKFDRLDMRIKFAEGIRAKKIMFIGALNSIYIKLKGNPMDSSMITDLRGLNNLLERLISRSSELNQYLRDELNKIKNKISKFLNKIVQDLYSLFNNNNQEFDEGKFKSHILIFEYFSDWFHEIYPLESEFIRKERNHFNKKETQAQFLENLSEFFEKNESRKTIIYKKITEYYKKCKLMSLLTGSLEFKSGLNSLDEFVENRKGICRQFEWQISMHNITERLNDILDLYQEINLIYESEYNMRRPCYDILSIRKEFLKKTNNYLNKIRSHHSENKSKALELDRIEHDFVILKAMSRFLKFDEKIRIFESKSIAISLIEHNKYIIMNILGDAQLKNLKETIENINNIEKNLQIFEIKY